MGCNSSAPEPAPLPAGLQAATREYFGFGEVPLTLKATARGSVLEIKAAGLDRDDLLTVLESGFFCRGYWISEATVHVDSGLFLANFELRDRKREGEHDDTEAEVVAATPRKCSHVDVMELVGAPTTPGHSPSKRSDNGEQFAEDLSLVKVPSVSEALSPSKAYVSDPHEVRQVEAADRHAFKRGAALRLTLMRDWAPGLRLALEKTIRAAGFRMIMGRFSMARRTTLPTVKDTLWLSQSLAEVSTDFTSGLPEWLLGVGETLQMAGLRAAKPSAPAPADIPAPADVELRVKQMAMSEREHQQLSLPSALQEKASKLHYRLEAATWGLQIEGLDKFCGSGMCASHTGQHVLEFATYYARARSSTVSTTNSWPHSFGAMVSALKGEEVAEFVTQYSPPRNCLTIQKVFLNGVCPSGQRLGARLVAEQLLHMPVRGDPKWDGLQAVRNLRRIHLFDVVNWNTYAIMSWATEAPSRIKHTPNEKLFLQEEAKTAGLTLADVTSKPIAQVFARTALGKCVRGMLQVWRDNQAVDYQINRVTVRFSSQHELILGEFRSMMEIDVDLREGPDTTPDAN